MKRKSSMYVAVTLLTVLAIWGIPSRVQAQQTWNATVGGQSKDMGKQAIAFLPNELWIHEGDSITWTSGSGEIHTVSFLIAGQKLTSFVAGCPGFSPSGVSFDGSTCVTAPRWWRGKVLP